MVQHATFGVWSLLVASGLSIPSIPLSDRGVAIRRSRPLAPRVVSRPGLVVTDEAAADTHVQDAA